VITRPIFVFFATARGDRAQLLRSWDQAFPGRFVRTEKQRITCHLTDKDNTLLFAVGKVSCHMHHAVHQLHLSIRSAARFSLPNSLYHLAPAEYFQSRGIAEEIKCPLKHQRRSCQDLCLQGSISRAFGTAPHTGHFCPRCCENSFCRRQGNAKYER